MATVRFGICDGRAVNEGGWFIRSLAATVFANG